MPIFFSWVVPDCTPSANADTGRGKLLDKKHLDYSLNPMSQLPLAHKTKLPVCHSLGALPTAQAQDVGM